MISFGRLLIACWAVLETCAVAAPVPLQAGGTLPRPGVLLFWASWCVPCRAEVKRLPALAAAARPLPLAVIALDPPETARASLGALPAGVAAFAEPSPPGPVLAAWGGPAARLPLTVAIDGRGRTCAVKHGLLGTDQLHAWSRRCSS